MKKKFLSFMFTLCLITLGAVYFVACGDDPPSEPTKITITLDANGGVLPSDQSTIISLEKDKKIDWPKLPTKNGHDFIGWTLDKDGNNYYKFDTEVTSNNITLYAQYIDENTFTYELDSDNNTYTITGGAESLTRVVTPFMHNGKVVDKIGYMAFCELTEEEDEYGQPIISGHQNMKELIITPNIITIDDAAFGYANNLESVYFYNGCETLGKAIFDCCDKLASVRLPETLTSMDIMVFDDCDSLTSVKIPNSITVLPSRTFSYCDNLTTITVSNQLTRIGSYCFEDTKLSNFVIPETVTYIEEGAFIGTKLTNITIPASVENLGRANFYQCEDLVTVTFMNNVSQGYSVKDDLGMFAYCTSLRTVNLPDTFTQISRNMFAHCTSLESFTLPRDCNYIAYQGFFGCSNLRNFTFNNKLETISDRVFVGAAITVNNLPDSVKSIGENAFNHFADGHSCTLNFTKLPDSLERISGSTFYGWNPFYLESFPAGLVYILGNNPFYNTLFPETICIPEGTSAIYENAFDSNRNIKKVVLPQGITSINAEAFRYSYITEINIPASVTSIGEYAFANCPYLTKITFEGKNINIHPTAFYNTDGAGILTIGTDVDEITEQQFKGRDFKVVIIPENVEKIGKSAFENCTNLQQVIFSEGLQVIEENAFKGCTSITNLQIPDSVTSVGKGAFINLDNLQFLELGTDFDYEDCTFDEIFSLDKSLIEVNNKSEKDLSSYINENSSIINIYNGNTGISGIVSDADYEWFISDTQVILLKCKTKFDGFDINLVLPSNKNGRNYKIGPSAFEGITNISKVTLPSGLLSIGKNAFKDCTMLQEINIPSSITKIEDGTFRGCFSLSNINLHDNITYIGSHAFDTTRISSINLTDNLTFVGYEAFIGTELTQTEYNNVSYIGTNNNPYLIAVSSVAENVIFHDDCDFVICTAASYYGFTKEIYIHDGIKSVDMHISHDSSSKCKVFISQPTEIESWNFVQNWYNEYAIENFEIFWNTREVKSNETFKYLITLDNKVTILGMAQEQNNVYNVDIPETIDTYPVTTIASHAFERDSHGFNNINLLNLTNNITHIGEYAFYNSGAVLNQIPSNIEYIGEYAFASTAVLNPHSRKIFLPETLIYVGSHAFANDHESGGAIVPIYTAHTAIPSTWAIDWASVSENSIAYPNVITGIRYWGNNGDGFDYVLFNDNTAGIVHNIVSDGYGEFLTIPSDTAWQGESNQNTNTLEQVYPIIKICDYAFYGLGYWGDVQIPNTIVTIGDFAFCGIAANITLNNGLQSIGKYAFGLNQESSQPSADADLVGGFPSTLHTIGDYGFAGVVIPDDYIIPNTLINLGEGALYTSSDTFRTAFTEKPTGWHNSWSDKIVYWGFIETYSNANYIFGLLNNNKAVLLKALNIMESEGNEPIILPQTVTKGTITYTVIGIGYETFKNNNENVINGDLIIPYTYKFIADYAFALEAGITSIAIQDTTTNPSELTYIGKYAFYACDELASINLPNNLKYVGENAFRGCNSLTSITIPNSFTNFEYYAFSYSGIQIMIISGGVKEVRYVLHYEMENLQTIIYCEGIESVEISYWSNPSLTMVILPSTLNYIEGYSPNSDTKIFYNGTYEDLQEVENADCIYFYENIYFYSATEPLDSNYNYWHYDTDGTTPISWE